MVVSKEMVKRFDDLQQLNTAAAELFVQNARAAIAERDRFTVALTGGSSPVALYRLLASPAYRDQVQWDKVYVFWGDERWVPLDDERSNARMSFETLLSHVPVPPSQVFAMWADGVMPDEQAQTYEAQLRQHLRPEGSFDLILLGMGGDGHTASWFPHTDVLNERDKWVAAYYLPEQDMYRITLTVPLINRAKKIAVITFGAGKADALYEVLKGERNTELYPAQLLPTDDHQINWLVDRAAAAKL